MDETKQVQLNMLVAVPLGTHAHTHRTRDLAIVLSIVYTCQHQEISNYPPYVQLQTIRPYKAAQRQVRGSKCSNLKSPPGDRLHVLHRFHYILAVKSVTYNSTTHFQSRCECE